MEENYPDLKDRIQSMFIDYMLIVGLMFTFTEILEDFENVPNWLRITLLAGLFVVYEPICVALGATVGNLMMGIRVREHSEPTQKITLTQSYIRYLAKIFLGAISFFTIHSNPQRRAIHDLISGSVMTKK